MKPSLLELGAVACLTLGLPAIGGAATHMVRPDGQGDFPTIQAAMDGAAAGDTIALADGTYRGSGNRDLDPLGKPLVIRSLSDSPRDCVIDCEGSAIDPHRGFYFHNVWNMTVRGLTVRGGYPAAGGGGAGIQCGVEWDPGQGAGVVVDNCVISQSASGAGMAVEMGSSAVATNSVFSDNAGSGLYAIYAEISFHDCTFTRNSSDGATILGVVTLYCNDCTFTDNDGSGFALHADQGWVFLSRCTLVGNRRSGLVIVTAVGGHLSVDSCTITDNSEYGIVSDHEGCDVAMVDCNVSQNGISGVQMNDSNFDCLASDFVGNLRSGVVLNGLSLYGGDVNIQACRVIANGGVGLRIRAASTRGNVVRMAGTLVCRNDSAGVRISAVEPARANVASSTIAHNGGEGLTAVGLDSLVIDHSVLVGNRSDVGDILGIGSIAVSCTDVFGHDGNDWTGALAPWYGSDGNVAVDPLFCGASLSDYSLRAGSPCASPISGECGLIGALPVACGLTGVQDPIATVTHAGMAVEPNPFNPRTTIRFDLPAAGPVRLAVYDLAGRLVRVLVEGERAAGSYEAIWDGRDTSGRSAPSGGYLARLVAGGKVEGVRLSLVR